MPSTPYITLNDTLSKSYERENRGLPRLFARYVLSQLPPMDKGSLVHDNACGPAIVTSEILSGHVPPGTHCAPTDIVITATDISVPMISAAEDLIKVNKWPNVSAEVLDSQDLAACGIKDDIFTHSITNFGLFMLEDCSAGARSIYRSLRHGGTAAITTWKYHGFVDLLARTSEVVRPDAELTGVLRNKWPIKERITDILTGAGFQADNIDMQARREWLTFTDEQDLADLMTGQIAKYATKDWTDEERARIGEVAGDVLTLEERRDRRLAMDAWVVIATKQDGS